jgi:hypothetical protein
MRSTEWTPHIHRCSIVPNNIKYVRFDSDGTAVLWQMLVTLTEITLHMQPFQPIKIQSWMFQYEVLFEILVFYLVNEMWAA